MRLFRTILLAIIAAFSIAAAIIVSIDGNLSSLVGYTGFSKGERLFPYSHQEISEISWMRVQDIHQTAEAHRLPNGVWWMSKPWDDRMDPRAAAAILQFTYSTSIVDALPLNNTVSASMREFGVETTPVHITLKKARADGDNATTLARYTLGSTAPWLVDDPEHETVDATTYMRSDFRGKNDRILVTTGNILPLFKESVNQLRDHRPLLLSPPTSTLPNQPREMVISTKRGKIVLQRESLADVWFITSPMPLQVNHKAVLNLVNKLQLLTASRVYNPDEAYLPDLPESELTTITLTTFASAQPVTLTIYPPDSSTATTVRATVSDRKAVFDLPLEDNDFVPGVSRLPLSLSELRTPYMVNIDRSNLSGVSIRSSSQPFPLVVRLLEGDKNRSIASRWLYSAEGNSFSEASEEQFFNLLSALVSTPVKNFVTDTPADMGVYGLSDPAYIITIGYKPQDPPIPPQMIFLGQGSDNSWYASVDGKSTVYEVGEDFMKAIKTDDLSWKPKKLFNFSRLNLKKLTLTRTGEPSLILSYDHLLDAWQAMRDGQDVTAEVNPNRARYYLTALEGMEVRHWLPYSDQASANALENPVFTLTMELEEQVGEDERLNIVQPPNNAGFTQLPVPEENTVKKVITLQIAPAGVAGYSSHYYGRINTSPYYFILDMNAVKLLGASVYEQ